MVLEAQIELSERTALGRKNFREVAWLSQDGRKKAYRDIFLKTGLAAINSVAIAYLRNRCRLSTASNCNADVWDKAHN